MTETYPNADARPHTGDRVKINSSKTPRLKGDVAGKVTGSHKSAATGNTKIKVMHGPKCSSHLYSIEALSLLEATENRFDGFEPGVVEDWEPPAIRYGTYVPSGYEGGLVIENTDSRVKVKRKPSTSDDRVIKFMNKHGWQHDFTRDDAGSHGIMFFSPDQ